MQKISERLRKLPHYSLASSPNHRRGRSTSCLPWHLLKSIWGAACFMAAFLLLAWMILTSIGNGRVQPGPLSEQHLTDQEILMRINCHGTLYAWYGQDGQWHFLRKGTDRR